MPATQGRLLTAAQFQGLAEAPPEAEWYIPAHLGALKRIDDYLD